MKYILIILTILIYLSELFFFLRREKKNKEKFEDFDFDEDFEREVLNQLYKRD